VINAGKQGVNLLPPAVLPGELSDPPALLESSANPTDGGFALNREYTFF
jgi:hypothetical protein